MLRIALVQCYGSMQPLNAEPLSVETLAGATHESLMDRADVKIYTLSNREPPSCLDLVKMLSENEISLVGVSIPQSSLRLAQEFLDMLYSICPPEILVLGNSLPSHLPELFLESYPEALIVCGWGEESFRLIVEHCLDNRHDFESIPNLIFNRNDQIVRTAIRWPTESPKPVRILPSDYLWRVESSRGCHYNACTFCTRPPRRGSTVLWQRFHIDDILFQIERLHSAGVTNFTFTDEDFIGDDLDGAERIADHLIDLRDMRFSLSLRVDNVINPQDSPVMSRRRKQLLRKLRKAGLSRAFLGVESLSNSQLKRYGKGVEAEDSLMSIQWLATLGIPTEIGFILFDPFMTIEEIEESIHWLRVSSTWKLVGQIYNHLRLQVDAPITRLAKSGGLLGSLNVDQLDFDYKFADDYVGEIARFCIHWKESIDGVFAAARNVSRSSMGDPLCDEFVQNVKELQLRMLSDILRDPKQQSLQIPDYHESEPRNLVYALFQNLQGSYFRSSSTAVQELGLGIEAYLDRSTLEG
jgi:hypothetical protein